MKHLRAHEADTGQIGAVAALALEEIYCAIYGRAPETTRAWTEGDAILLLMRIDAAQATPTPVDEMQRMVAVAVERRTGVALRVGGVNIDTDRGLAVLAFERVETPAAPAEGPIGAGPVHGAG